MSKFGMPSEPKLVGGERAGFDEEEEGERSIAMVSQSGSGKYDAKADAKHFAGLMTLDQIKAKRSRLDSGEEFEDDATKMAKAKRVDDIMAAKEAQARAARMAAKQEKLKQELEKGDKAGEGGGKDGQDKEGGAVKKKKKDKKKGGAALSFNADEDGEGEDQ